MFLKLPLLFTFLAGYLHNSNARQIDMFGNSFQQQVPKGQPFRPSHYVLPDINNIIKLVGPKDFFVDLNPVHRNAVAQLTTIMKCKLHAVPEGVRTGTRPRRRHKPRRRFQVFTLERRHIAFIFS